MVGMADHDDPPDSDSTDPILDEHADVRRRFVELWNERTSGDAGAVAIDAAWQPIADLLDGHASVDAAAAHPTLLKPDGAEAPNADFHAASSTLVSGELVVELSVVPPGDGDGGQVGLA